MTIKTDMLFMMQGDCLQRMNEIEPCSVDFVLTDLPYGTQKLEWDVVIPFDLMWNAIKRIAKPNACICLVTSHLVQCLE